MPAVALTDRGNLFGALEFAVTAADAGLQPVVGAVLGLNRASDEPGATTADPDRLLLLAQDQTGYENLIALVSKGFLEGEGIEPAVDFDDLSARAEGLIAQVAAATGMRDEAVVAHEPFFQWVLEDDFGEGPRPALEDAGVQLVAEVEPFERMKLRMLNGTHSALAYMGLREGHKTVAEAMADPALSARIEALWSRELAPSLIAPPGPTSTLMPKC